MTHEDWYATKQRNKAKIMELALLADVDLFFFI